jgi:hypothetical protein
MFNKSFQLWSKSRWTYQEAENAAEFFLPYIWECVVNAILYYIILYYYRLDDVDDLYLFIYLYIYMCVYTMHYICVFFILSEWMELSFVGQTKRNHSNIEHYKQNSIVRRALVRL